MNLILFCCPLAPLSPWQFSMIENSDEYIGYAFDMTHYCSHMRGMLLNIVSGSIVRQPAPDGPWSLPYQAGQLLGQCGLSFNRD